VPAAGSDDLVEDMTETATEDIDMNVGVGARKVFVGCKFASPEGQNMKYGGPISVQFFRTVVVEPRLRESYWRRHSSEFIHKINERRSTVSNEIKKIHNRKFQRRCTGNIMAFSRLTFLLSLQCTKACAETVRWSLQSRKCKITEVGWSGVRRRKEEPNLISLFSIVEIYSGMLEDEENQGNFWWRCNEQIMTSSHLTFLLSL
jgi:hypothetical protein